MSGSEQFYKFKRRAVSGVREQLVLLIEQEEKKKRRRRKREEGRIFWEGTGAEWSRGITRKHSNRQDETTVSNST